MKKYLYSLGVVLALAACTSEESKVKTMAIEAARGRLQTQMREEIAKSVTGKDNLQKTAANILTEKSEFEVSHFELKADKAFVTVEVQAVPEKVRQALIEIMAKLDEKKEKTFNVSNAIQLINQQLGLDDGSRDLMVYKLNLEKNNEWRVKEP